MLSGIYMSTYALFGYVQVIVNDVHIRYEDPEADPAHPLTVGVLLENLSTQSTDEFWVSGCGLFCLHVNVCMGGALRQFKLALHCVILKDTVNQYA